RGLPDLSPDMAGRVPVEEVAPPPEEVALVSDGADVADVLRELVGEALRDRDGALGTGLRRDDPGRLDVVALNLPFDAERAAQEVDILDAEPGHLPQAQARERAHGHESPELLGRHIQRSPHLLDG